MALFKTVLVWCTCLILLAGNIANAAIPCCCMSGDETQVHMQMADSESTMPCHEKENSSPTDETLVQCDLCGCMHGAQASILPVTFEPIYALLTDTLPLYQQRQLSDLHDLIFQPPKPLS